VVENASDVYTYTYNVNNPAGDVLLNNAGQPTSTSEVVDTFMLTFDASVPGAVVSGPTGGSGAANLGSFGLIWVLPSVPAGANSGSLSFTSDEPPTWADASAADANPPSPWSSSPDGQTVPVPMTASVPDSLNTLVWLAGTAPLLALALKRKATRP
jgi:hypothetical protein